MIINTIDLLIIIAYFAIILVIGILVSKRAIKDIDSYFLGSNALPWWILGISNASGMFDITGTMWLVYLMFVYGLKSVWIPWLWPIFNQIFLMAYLSIWLRRSNVMTGAQWIETRFGNGKGARLAHYIVVCFALVSLVGFIAYDFKGIGKFAKIFLPWDLSPDVYAIILMSITAIYAVKGGMVSVVATEVLQFFVMTIASITVGIVAMNAIAPETLNAVVPSGWKEVFFGWHLNLDWSGIMDSVNQKIAQDGYELFTIFMMMVLFKGILVSAAGPAPNYDMQRILATKNPKEAAKMSWFVSVVLFFPRYMMIAGLTVLALVFLMPELKAMGSNIDFEMVLPLALKNLIPVGLVGVLLAGLLAAFMSTYAATLNAAPAYVVNDIYKKFINPNAPPKKYVKLSIIVSIFFAVLGFVFGILAQSVNQVTLWIVNGLWGGYTAANVLKWYWWRLNGYGYFWGMVIGIACALLMPVLFPNLPALTAFPYVLAVSVIGSILGSYLTEPEPDEVLMKFYVKVRPWGLWKPIRKKVEARFPEFKSDANFKRDIFNVVVGIIWQSTLLAAPMYLVIKEYKSFVITLIITLITSITLKFTWWNKLEEIAGEKTEKFYNEIAEKI
ncbi:sodium:solute symporter family protein [Ignavibacteria bacterium 4148-Me]|uniref:sodium:solute symporter family protein n=1 Tax=Rosettibacter primus TaxID=3111523 RepID=UPI00336BE980